MNKDEYIKQLEEENKKLKEKISLLEKRIAQLENPPSMNPRMSTFSIYRPNRKTRQKRPGRKKGHKGVARPMPDHVDEVVELKYKVCPDCATKLTTMETRTRIVEDIIPRRNYHVKMYVIHRHWCPKCREVKSPKPLDVIPKCRFGINFLLFVIFQKFVLKQTIEDIQTELKTYFGLRVSRGEIIQTLHRGAKLFSPEYEAMKQIVRSSGANCVDETGWRVNGVNHWVWGFVNDRTILYKIDRRRGHEVPKRILGRDYSGVVTSDRYASYNKLEEKTKSAQQKCWVHILRNSKKLAETYEEAKPIHRELKRAYKRAKKLEGRGTQKHIDKILERLDREVLHRTYRHQDTKKFVKSLLVRHRDNLFRFVTNPAVKSHNNDAERALRKPVVIRKISGGNRSQKGVETTEVLLSVVQSARQQGRDFITEGREYLQNAIINSQG